MNSATHEIASADFVGLATTEGGVAIYIPRYVFLIVSSLSNSWAVPWAMTCPLDIT